MQPIGKVTNQDDEENNKHLSQVFAAGSSSYSSSPACSLSSGSILSRTWEYWTLALTQAARGAAAALARFAFWKQNKVTSQKSSIDTISQPSIQLASRFPAKGTFGSNEAVFLLSSSSTLWRISGVMFLASNVAMSSLTPRLARKLKTKS